MPDAAPAARPAAQGQANGNRREESAVQKFLRFAQQALLIYFVTQFVTKFFAPQQPATTPVPVPQSSADVPPGQPNPFDLAPVTAHLSKDWPIGGKLDMHVYLSTTPFGDVFSAKRTQGRRKDNDAGLPHFVWENITFGDYNEARTVEYDVHLPESVQNNGSLWADVFLVKEGANPDPFNAKFDPKAVHHFRKLLTTYLPKSKVRKQKSLLKAKEGEQADVPKEEEPADIIASHWHRNLTLALISNEAIVPYGQLPVPLHPFIYLEPGVRDATGKVGYYRPIIYPNDFWHLREQYAEINSTTPVLPLQITFQPMSYFKFQMFASLSTGFEQAAKQQGGSTGAELDEIKRMLTETNPWFLALTATVSILHMVFEMLAFTSDVSHWRKKQELVGVSVRTIITNVFVQIVVLLYLIDNNENTSWMIIFSSGMGVVIEAWKITKTVDIKLVPAPPGETLPYKLEIKDKHVLSEDERKTQEFDKLAFRYVSYVAIPLLFGYAIYSLVYDTHKGWYSFVITTLTSFVYMFGFAQLVPQLIINYKLKSVAHMPMKAMVYKTLSTVVDDLFAFCIKMPMLHRLACFRDDVVFLIFLYQRWIYRIDPKRVNEYGQALTPEQIAAAEAEGTKGESRKER